jgi:hypothetical protein
LVVGPFVGASVGDAVGLELGAVVGSSSATKVMVGLCVGADQPVGLCVGADHAVGPLVGGPQSVGAYEGAALGGSVSSSTPTPRIVGMRVGAQVGLAVVSYGSGSWTEPPESVPLLVWLVRPPGGNTRIAPMATAEMAAIPMAAWPSLRRVDWLTMDACSISRIYCMYLGSFRRIGVGVGGLE